MTSARSKLVSLRPAVASEVGRCLLSSTVGGDAGIAATIKYFSDKQRCTQEREVHATQAQDAARSQSHLLACHAVAQLLRAENDSFIALALAVAESDGNDTVANHGGSSDISESDNNDKAKSTGKETEGFEGNRVRDEKMDNNTVMYKFGGDNNDTDAGTDASNDADTGIDADADAEANGCSAGGRHANSSARVTTTVTATAIAARARARAVRDSAGATPNAAIALRVLRSRLTQQRAQNTKLRAKLKDVALHAKLPPSVRGLVASPLDKSNTCSLRAAKPTARPRNVSAPPSPVPVPAKARSHARVLLGHAQAQQPTPGTGVNTIADADTKVVASVLHELVQRVVSAAGEKSGEPSDAGSRLKGSSVAVANRGKASDTLAASGGGTAAVLAPVGAPRAGQALAVAMRALVGAKRQLKRAQAEAQAAKDVQVRAASRLRSLTRARPATGGAGFVFGGRDNVKGIGSSASILQRGCHRSINGALAAQPGRHQLRGNSGRATRWCGPLPAATPTPMPSAQSRSKPAPMPAPAPALALAPAPRPGIRPATKSVPVHSAGAATNATKAAGGSACKSLAAAVAEAVGSGGPSPPPTVAAVSLGLSAVSSPDTGSVASTTASSVGYDSCTGSDSISIDGQDDDSIEAWVARQLEGGVQVNS